MNAEAGTQSLPNDRSNSLFQRGEDAHLKGNTDYAIAMFRQALELAPYHLPYRQALRGAQRAKYDNDAKRVGRLVGARLQPLRLKMKSAKSRKNYGHVLELAEDAFAIHPWDVTTALEASEAASELGQHPLAIWLLEVVTSEAKDDVTLFRTLAQAHEACGNWKRAISCWEQVKRIKPSDQDAGHQIRFLAANEANDRFSKGKGRQAEQPEPSPSQAEDDLGKQWPVATAEPERPRDEQLRKRIEINPNEISAYLELAEYYRERGKIDRAAKVLEFGLKQNPHEPRLHHDLNCLQEERLHRAIEHWSAQVKADPDDTEAVAKLQQARTLLQEQILGRLKQLVEAKPTDANLRMKLGDALCQAGRDEEAIPEFQHARSDETLRVQALLKVGDCFQRSGVQKLAQRSYLDALKAAGEDDDSRVELHYRLGKLAQAQGDLEAAEEHYNEVAAIDYSFQDVAARLRSLQQTADS